MSLEYSTNVPTWACLVLNIDAWPKCGVGRLVFVSLWSQLSLRTCAGAPGPCSPLVRPWRPIGRRTDPCLSNPIQSNPIDKARQDRPAWRVNSCRRARAVTEAQTNACLRLGGFPMRGNGVERPCPSMEAYPGSPATAGTRSAIGLMACVIDHPKLDQA